ncbi:Crp/Fnr family transcriptional regulator [Flavobacterium silvaticum]|uniref:Crp/Fnr family transcriptional regulator n=1 Tax=Flavobacterium silvaticum TaxID=1852020 RepID=A0A972FLF2_9FLAO|nr:Crp/Fnr family transcriptional regulator [Flavobacterium silvaticum]NMH27400.1 Crp/Fnr family transcriptional regulator [Flavobacterium silvaticum]
MEVDIDIFLKSVRAICPHISDFELSQFASQLTINELKKKAYFLESDTVQAAIGFITKGLVRSFYIDADGNEITVGFYPEGDYATHFASFIKQEPSKYSIQCLEDTTLVCLSLEGMNWIYQQAPVFERYGRLIAGGILTRQQDRIESFIFQSSEERYLDFINNHPGLFNRISISHLCSYLGIERQTLTRIRHKLAHQ